MKNRIRRIDPVIAACVAVLILIFAGMGAMIRDAIRGTAPENTVAMIETETGIIEVEVDRYWGPGRNNVVTIRGKDGSEYRTYIFDVIFISREE